MSNMLKHWGELMQGWQPLLTRDTDCDLMISAIPVVLGLAAILCIYLYFRLTAGRVYLLDFSCYKPPPSQQVTVDQCLWGLHTFGKAENKRNGYKDEIAFQTRIQHNNGVSEKTYGPTGFFQPRPILTLEEARQESKLCMMGAVREAMSKLGLKPKDIDVLIVNCSLFNPTPSLCAMIINHFKFKSTITSYNLSGMGCSAGIISIDLARQMLELSPNKYALVVSTENITLNWYQGSQRSFLIPNTLFRVGASAAIMTNKRSERYRAKYQLMNTVRITLGADPEAYQCVFQKADKEGIVGVALNKDIVKVAAKALEKNLTLLGPKVLPYSEQLIFAYDWILRRLGWREGKPYQPKFKKAFEHFCIHAGGRGVIEGLGGELGLTQHQLEPSFSALYFYGNTSSSSYWYSFGFAESKHGMKKGDRVWQIGFGSGFKSNSAVWKAMRTFKDPNHKAWAEIGLGDIKDMWADLKGMGITFKDGVMPPYEEKRRAENGVVAAKEQMLVANGPTPAKATPAPETPNGPTHRSVQRVEAGPLAEKPPMANGHKVENGYPVEGLEARAEGQPQNGAKQSLKQGKVLSELPLHTFNV